MIEAATERWERDEDIAGGLYLGERAIDELWLSAASYDGLLKPW